MGVDQEQGLFSGYFRAGRENLRAKLEECRDLTEVEDTVRLYWDSMQHEFTSNVTDGRARELGFELFVVAKSAISCMLSVSQAEVLFKAAPPERVQEHRFDWKQYVGAGATLLLSAYLLMEGMWAPMGVGLFATGWQVAMLRKVSVRRRDVPALPEAQVLPWTPPSTAWRRARRRRSTPMPPIRCRYPAGAVWRRLWRQRSPTQTNSRQKCRICMAMPAAFCVRCPAMPALSPPPSTPPRM